MTVLWIVMPIVGATVRLIDGMDDKATVGRWDWARSCVAALDRLLCALPDDPNILANGVITIVRSNWKHRGSTCDDRPSYHPWDQATVRRSWADDPGTVASVRTPSSISSGHRTLLATVGQAMTATILASMR